MNQRLKEPGTYLVRREEKLKDTEESWADVMKAHGHRLKAKRKQVMRKGSPRKRL